MFKNPKWPPFQFLGIETFRKFVFLQRVLPSTATKMLTDSEVPPPFSVPLFLILLRRSSKDCIVTQVILFHSTEGGDNDLNTFFNSLIKQAISHWLLSAEQAMLEIYSTVYHHITNKTNSHTSTFETTHLK